MKRPDSGESRLSRRAAAFVAAFFAVFLAACGGDGGVSLVGSSQPEILHTNDGSSAGRPTTPPPPPPPPRVITEVRIDNAKEEVNSAAEAVVSGEASSLPAQEAKADESDNLQSESAPARLFSAPVSGATEGPAAAAGLLVGQADKGEDASPDQPSSPDDKRFVYLAPQDVSDESTADGEVDVEVHAWEFQNVDDDQVEEDVRESAQFLTDDPDFSAPSGSNSPPLFLQVVSPSPGVVENDEIAKFFPRVASDAAWRGDNDQIFNYAVAAGFYEGEYAAFGFFVENPGDFTDGGYGVPSDELGRRHVGAFAYGLQTPARPLAALEGRALYSGFVRGAFVSDRAHVARGVARLWALFGANSDRGELTGEFALTAHAVVGGVAQSAAAGRVTLTLESVALDGAGFSAAADAAKLKPKAVGSGVFSGFATTDAGAINGGFYGPSGDEIAGSFSLSKTGAWLRAGFLVALADKPSPPAQTGRPARVGGSSIAAARVGRLPDYAATTADAKLNGAERLHAADVDGMAALIGAGSGDGKGVILFAPQAAIAAAGVHGETPATVHEWNFRVAGAADAAWLGGEGAKVAALATGTGLLERSGSVNYYGRYSDNAAWRDEATRELSYYDVLAGFYEGDYGGFGYYVEDADAFADSYGAPTDGLGVRHIGFFHYGLATPEMAVLSRRGAASYTGFSRGVYLRGDAAHLAEGKVSLRADFAGDKEAGSLTGEFLLTAYAVLANKALGGAAAGDVTLALESVDISGNGFSADVSSNKFKPTGQGSGVFSSFAATDAGEIDGEFYGPDALQSAGSFSLSKSGAWLRAGFLAGFAPPPPPAQTARPSGVGESDIAAAKGGRLPTYAASDASDKLNSANRLVAADVDGAAAWIGAGSGDGKGVVLFAPQAAIDEDAANTATPATVHEWNFRVAGAADATWLGGEGAKVAALAAGTGLLENAGAVNYYGRYSENAAWRDEATRELSYYDVLAGFYEGDYGGFGYYVEDADAFADSYGAPTDGLGDRHIGFFHYGLATPAAVVLARQNAVSYTGFSRGVYLRGDAAHLAEGKVSLRVDFDSESEAGELTGEFLLTAYAVLANKALGGAAAGSVALTLESVDISGNGFSADVSSNKFKPTGQGSGVFDVFAATDAGEIDAKFYGPGVLQLAGSFELTKTNAWLRAGFLAGRLPEELPDPTETPSDIVAADIAAIRAQVRNAALPGGAALPPQEAAADDGKKLNGVGAAQRLHSAGERGALLVGDGMEGGAEADKGFVFFVNQEAANATHSWNFRAPQGDAETAWAAAEAAVLAELLAGTALGSDGAAVHVRYSDNARRQEQTGETGVVDVLAGFYEGDYGGFGYYVEEPGAFTDGSYNALVGDYADQFAALHYGLQTPAAARTALLGRASYTGFLRGAYLTESAAYMAQGSAKLFALFGYERDAGEISGEFALTAHAIEGGVVAAAASEGALTLTLESVAFDGAGFSAAADAAKLKPKAVGGGVFSRFTTTDAGAISGGFYGPSGDEAAGGFSLSKAGAWLRAGFLAGMVAKPPPPAMQTARPADVASIVGAEKAKVLAAFTDDNVDLAAPEATNADKLIGAELLHAADVDGMAALVGDRARRNKGVVLFAPQAAIAATDVHGETPATVHEWNFRAAAATDAEWLRVEGDKVAALAAGTGLLESSGAVNYYRRYSENAAWRDEDARELSYYDVLAGFYEGDYGGFGYYVEDADDFTDSAYGSPTDGLGGRHIGFFHYGLATPEMAVLSRRGAASYTGFSRGVYLRSGAAHLAEGKVSLRADFAGDKEAGSLTGEFLLTAYAVETTDKALSGTAAGDVTLALESVDLSGNGFSADVSSNKFKPKGQGSGVFSSFAVTDVGAIDADFYGPDASQLAGGFSLSKTNAWLRAGFLAGMVAKPPPPAQTARPADVASIVGAEKAKVLAAFTDENTELAAPSGGLLNSANRLHAADVDGMAALIGDGAGDDKGVVLFAPQAAIDEDAANTATPAMVREWNFRVAAAADATWVTGEGAKVAALATGTGLLASSGAVNYYGRYSDNAAWRAAATRELSYYDVLAGFYEGDYGGFGYYVEDADAFADSYGSPTDGLGARHIGFFHYGLATPEMAVLSRRGAASYTGFSRGVYIQGDAAHLAEGKVSLRADFAGDKEAGSLTGEFLLTAYAVMANKALAGSAAGSVALTLESVDLSGNGFSADVASNKFKPTGQGSGVFSSFAATDAGAIDGDFYGPDASQLAGGFSLSKANAWLRAGFLAGMVAKPPPPAQTARPADVASIVGAEKAKVLAAFTDENTELAAPSGGLLNSANRLHAADVDGMAALIGDGAGDDKGVVLFAPQAAIDEDAANTATPAMVREWNFRVAAAADAAWVTGEGARVAALAADTGLLGRSGAVNYYGRYSENAAWRDAATRELSYYDVLAGFYEGDYGGFGYYVEDADAFADSYGARTDGLGDRHIGFFHYGLATPAAAVLSRQEVASYTGFSRGVYLRGDAAHLAEGKVSLRADFDSESEAGDLTGEFLLTAYAVMANKALAGSAAGSVALTLESVGVSGNGFSADVSSNNFKVKAAGTGVFDVFAATDAGAIDAKFYGPGASQLAGSFELTKANAWLRAGFLAGDITSGPELTAPPSDIDATSIDAIRAQAAAAAGGAALPPQEATTEDGKKLNGAGAAQRLHSAGGAGGEEFGALLVGDGAENGAQTDKGFVAYAYQAEIPAGGGEAAVPAAAHEWNFRAPRDDSETAWAEAEAAALRRLLTGTELVNGNGGGARHYARYSKNVARTNSQTRALDYRDVLAGFYEGDYGGFAYYIENPDAFTDGDYSAPSADGDRFGAFYYGLQTPTADRLARTGTAVYTGFSRGAYLTQSAAYMTQGSASLAVNFGAADEYGMLTGEFALAAYAIESAVVATEAAEGALTLLLEETMMGEDGFAADVASGKFHPKADGTGVFSPFLIADKGSIAGAFYGPGARQSAGGFSLTKDGAWLRSGFLVGRARDPAMPTGTAFESPQLAGARHEAENSLVDGNPFSQSSLPVATDADNKINGDGNTVAFAVEDDGAAVFRAAQGAKAVILVDPGAAADKKFAYYFAQEESAATVTVGPFRHKDGAGAIDCGEGANACVLDGRRITSAFVLPEGKYTNFVIGNVITLSEATEATEEMEASPEETLTNNIIAIANGRLTEPGADVIIGSSVRVLTGPDARAVPWHENVQVAKGENQVDSISVSAWNFRVANSGSAAETAWEAAERAVLAGLWEGTALGGDDNPVNFYSRFSDDAPGIADGYADVAGGVFEGNYAAFGYWIENWRDFAAGDYPLHADVAKNRVHAFHYGLRTPTSAATSKMGKASYSGFARGTWRVGGKSYMAQGVAAFYADFETGNVNSGLHGWLTGEFALTAYAMRDGAVSSDSAGEVNLLLDRGDIIDNRFVNSTLGFFPKAKGTGAFSSLRQADYGSLSGGFFGPQAEQAAGTFKIETQSAELSGGFLLGTTALATPAAPNPTATPDGVTTDIAAAAVTVRNVLLNTAKVYARLPVHLASAPGDNLNSGERLYSNNRNGAVLVDEGADENKGFVVFFPQQIVSRYVTVTAGGNFRIGHFTEIFYNGYVEGAPNARSRNNNFGDVGGNRLLHATGVPTNFSRSEYRDLKEVPSEHFIVRNGVLIRSRASTSSNLSRTGGGTLRVDLWEDEIPGKQLRIDNALPIYERTWVPSALMALTVHAWNFAVTAAAHDVGWLAETAPENLTIAADSNKVVKFYPRFSEDAAITDPRSCQTSGDTAPVRQKNDAINLATCETKTKDVAAAFYQADYAAFGYWLQDPEDFRANDYGAALLTDSDFSAHHYGMETPRDALKARTGRASYVGFARGVYLSPAAHLARGRASLAVYFGDEEGLGALSGEFVFAAHAVDSAGAVSAASAGEITLQMGLTRLGSPELADDEGNVLAPEDIGFSARGRSFRPVEDGGGVFDKLKAEYPTKIVRVNTGTREEPVFEDSNVPDDEAAGYSEIDGGFYGPNGEEAAGVILVCETSDCSASGARLQAGFIVGETAE